MPARRDRPTELHRIDGTYRLDAPAPMPVKGTPGGWIDWFDDAQLEVIRIREQAAAWARQRDELIAEWRAERMAAGENRRGRSP